MIIQGLDTSTLPPQFEGATPGLVLILDGDGPAYSVAATTKTLPTAVRRYQQQVLTQLFLTKAESAHVHLTHEESDKAGRFRIKAAQPYQGKRAGKAKPALLAPLRAAVAEESNWLQEYDVTMHHVLEADDGMIMDSYRLKEHGIIMSDDKDLRMTPYAYWEKSKGVIYQPDPFGQLWMEYTASGTPKCLGHSLKFFWAQMMMGDTADHIKGLRRYKDKDCGAVTAFNVLHPLQCIDEVANAVIDAYRAINQNVLAEGYLLWLLRWNGDSFWNYLHELNLSPANKQYIYDNAAQDWFEKE